MLVSRVFFEKVLGIFCLGICLILVGCTDHKDFVFKNSDSKKMFDRLRLNYETPLSLDKWPQNGKGGRACLVHVDSRDLSLSFVVSRPPSNREFDSNNKDVVIGKAIVVFQQVGNDVKVAIEESLLTNDLMESELDSFIRDVQQQLKVDCFLNPNTTANFSVE